MSAEINYLGSVAGRPTFHAQEHGRDNIAFDPHAMAITDGRTTAEAPSLRNEGLMLAEQRSAVTDFRDMEQIQRIYLAEIAELIGALTGSSRVFTVPGGGFLRYAERSVHHLSGVNTQPARFPHIDWTPRTAPGLAAESFGGHAVRLAPGERLVGYNIWRAISGPPQDVPLAACDVRTIAPTDLVVADGVYDVGDQPWMTSEAYLLRHNPRHRWVYFSDMRADEALVFMAYDSGTTYRTGVPHTAFDNPHCPPDAPARVSIEARAYAVIEG